jgi:hypothetical protein
MRLLPFGTTPHLQNITISSFAKYTLKFLKLPYEKPNEEIILTYGMLSEFLGHLHFCQHLESATKYISSTTPQKKLIRVPQLASEDQLFCCRNPRHLN